MPDLTKHRYHSLLAVWFLLIQALKLLDRHLQWNLHGIFLILVETYSDAMVASTTLITVKRVNLFCSQNSVHEHTKFSQDSLVMTHTMYKWLLILCPKNTQGHLEEDVINTSTLWECRLELLTSDFLNRFLYLLCICVFLFLYCIVSDGEAAL